MKNREYPQAKYSGEHFRMTVFIPFVNDLLYDMEFRFDEDLMSIYNLHVVLQQNPFSMTNTNYKLNTVIDQFNIL